MPIENERKYVLEINQKLLKTLEQKTKPNLLSQFYMESTVGQSIRGRSIQPANPDDKKEFIFTYKYLLDVPGYPKGSNLEIEKEISEEDYHFLFDGSIRNLVKKRYIIEHMNLHWDIDIFYNIENNEVYFAMAEVEMPKFMAKPDSFPKWLRPFIIHDVEAGDNGFSSYALCDIPYALGIYDDIINNEYRPWKK